MNTNTEGIILKQIHTINGRRMITIFTKRYGKIQAGTTLSERSKGKAALGLRPFASGNYELYIKGSFYFLNAVEVNRYFYKLCEDVDKYAYGAYGLELANVFLEEEVPFEDFYQLLMDYLDLLEARNKDYLTLVLAFQIKTLILAGHRPILHSCSQCGKKKDLNFLSIKEGGLLCSECKEKGDSQGIVSLIYQVNEGIIDAIRYFMEAQIADLAKLVLKDDIAKEISSIIRDYIKYHLDIKDLMSEKCLIN